MLSDVRKVFYPPKQVNKVSSVPREPLVPLIIQEIDKNASQHALGASKVTEHENPMSSLLRSFQCHFPQMPGPLSGFSMTKYKVISEPIYVEEENGTHLYMDIYPCDGHKQQKTLMMGKAILLHLMQMMTSTEMMMR